MDPGRLQEGIPVPCGQDTGRGTLGHGRFRRVPRPPDGRGPLAAVLDPEVVSLLVARARRDDTEVGRLTPRQQEVLELMAQGRSNSWIARELTLTDKAVVQHTSHIYDALGLAPSDDDHRRVLAVLHHLTR